MFDQVVAPLALRLVRAETLRSQLSPRFSLFPRLRPRDNNQAALMEMSDHLVQS